MKGLFKRKNLIPTLALTLALSASLAGCGSNTAPSANTQSASPTATVQATPEATVSAAPSQTPQEEKSYAIDFEKEANEVVVTDTTVTFTDAAGQTVTMNKNPQKVVGLYNSYINLWWQAGGALVGRIDSDSELPDEIVNDTAIAKVGTLTQENIEAVTALDPDLVILREGKQGAYSESFKSNQIPYIAMEYDSFSDYLKWLKVFTALTGKDEIYASTGTALFDEIDSIIKKVPAENNPSVLLMFGTSKSVKAYLPNTAVGEMLSELGAANIAESWEKEEANATSVILNTEYLISADPDYILVQSMSSIDEVKAYIETTYGGESWWKDLSAVKNGRLVYLDRSLFHYKPNARYGEAYMELAKLLYPEVY